MKQELSQEVGQRIRQMRKDLDIKQKDFAAVIGISVSYLADIESGRTGPGYLFFYQASKEYNINPVYLLLGEGPKFIEIGRRLGESGEYSTEVKELLWYINNSPLVKFELLSHFSRFRMENENIIERDIKRHKK